MTFFKDFDKVNKIVTALRVIKKGLKEDPPCITLTGASDSDTVKAITEAMDNYGLKKNLQIDSSVPEDTCLISIYCNLSLDGENLLFEINKDWKIDPRERLFAKEKYSISEPFVKSKKKDTKPKQIDISGDYKYEKLVKELNDNISDVLSSAIP